MTEHQVPQAQRTALRRPVAPLLGAVAFLLCYLAVDFATGAVQNGDMPLPNDPADAIYAYLRDNTTASLLTGILQALSVLGLAVVVAGPVAAIGTRRSVVRILGATAVAAMLVSAGLSIALGLTATTASQDTVLAMREVNFFTGGVVHIVALGLFVFLATRAAAWTRPVRVMGWVAGVPAVLSILSVVFFYASPLLPLGRLLCMVCLIVAAVSLARGRTPVRAA